MSHQRKISRDRNEERPCLKVEAVGGIEEAYTEGEDDDMR
jgi:hypothetical protein